MPIVGVSLCFLIGCYFRDIIGRNDKYYNVIANVEQDCPPGTVFKPVLCRCTKDSAHNHQSMTSSLDNNNNDLSVQCNLILKVHYF